VIRDDDVFLVGYPQSGVHWLRKIVEQLFEQAEPAALRQVVKQQRARSAAAAAEKEAVTSEEEFALAGGDDTDIVPESMTTDELEKMLAASAAGGKAAQVAAQADVKKQAETEKALRLLDLEKAGREAGHALKIVAKQTIKSGRALEEGKNEWNEHAHAAYRDSTAIGEAYGEAGEGEAGEREQQEEEREEEHEEHEARDGQLRGIANAKWFEELTIAKAEAMPSPRYFFSHAPWSLLAMEPECKVRLVYICRNGLDVAAASFEHARRLPQTYEYAGDWDDYCARFMFGDIEYGSWFEHTSAWHRSALQDAVVARWQQRQPRVCVTQFESFLRPETCGAELAKVRDFLGLGDALDDAALSRVAEAASPREMRSTGDTVSFAGSEGEHGLWRAWYTQEQELAFRERVAIYFVGPQQLHFDYGSDQSREQLETAAASVARTLAEMHQKARWRAKVRWEEENEARESGTLRESEKIVEAANARKDYVPGSRAAMAEAKKREKYDVSGREIIKFHERSSAKEETSGMNQFTALASDKDAVAMNQLLSLEAREERERVEKAFRKAEIARVKEAKRQAKNDPALLELQEEGEKLQYVLRRCEDKMAKINDNEIARLLYGGAGQQALDAVLAEIEAHAGKILKRQGELGLLARSAAELPSRFPVRDSQTREHFQALNE